MNSTVDVDVGGTLMDENISRAAGATHGQGLDPEDLRAPLQQVGRRLIERTTLYKPTLDVQEVAG